MTDATQGTPDPCTTPGEKPKTLDKLAEEQKSLQAIAKQLEDGRTALKKYRERFDAFTSRVTTLNDFKKEQDAVPTPGACVTQFRAVLEAEKKVYCDQRALIVPLQATADTAVQARAKAENTLKDTSACLSQILKYSDDVDAAIKKLEAWRDPIFKAQGEGDHATRWLLNELLSIGLKGELLTDCTPPPKTSKGAGVSAAEPFCKSLQLPLQTEAAYESLVQEWVYKVKCAWQSQEDAKSKEKSALTDLEAAKKTLEDMRTKLQNKIMDQLKKIGCDLRQQAPAPTIPTPGEKEAVEY